MSLLNEKNYSQFPFQLAADGAVTTERVSHIRQQIEQVLFTDPGERWFRPEFGAGIRALVFEPQNSALWQITKQRLQSSLSEALAGEVSPKDLQIDVNADEDFPERLLIKVSYKLTAISHSEMMEFEVSGSVR